MNAMIRAVKGILALAALAGLGLALRWMTAGSISGVNRYDLDSMTVLVVGTVAWIAYGWLVLAVVATVLEQLPGAIGALAGGLSRQITSTTARTLLRSSLGVAAVTPLTISVAHATPGDSGSGHAWARVEPRSTVQLTDATSWRATEPASTVDIAASSGTTGSGDWRDIEPPSTVRLTESATPRPPQSTRRLDAPNSNATANPTRPAPDNTHRPAGAPRPGAAGADGRGDAPVDGRMRVGVPDRPTAGAGTRYTDLRSGVPSRIVVKAGDSLWSIAARELGPAASNEAIAARWPQWYAANRQVIGSDPDLIRPGQVLHSPAAATGNHVPPTLQEK